MIKRCTICGLPKRILITCKRCGKLVCLNDFWTKEGLCSDCIIEVYNVYYGEAIKCYESMV